MKTTTPLFRVMLIALCLASVAGALAAPRDAQWEKVDDAVRAGLPQTAIDALGPIISDAIADKAYAEAIKAIGRKIAFEGQIQGNKPEEKIARMQAAIESSATPEMKPAMETILAHWYWQYFQRNRWDFMQRTRTAEAPGADIQTWDLARILAEIDRHFTAALADEATLKATPVSAFDDLLEKGNVPDSYRPTMFDFLVYEALPFYAAGEQGSVESEDAFELDPAKIPLFADASEFMAWQPPAGTDANAPTLKALRLLQGLMKFHERDADRSAFFDADLARLRFAFNKAIDDDKDERYQRALERFIEATAKHEISARARSELAEQIYDNGDAVRAHEIAKRGLDAFPNTAGGSLCYNLIQRIEAKSSRLETERVWNAPWPTLDVTYRNVTKVYFRAVPADFARVIRRVRWSLDQFDEDHRKEILAAKPVLEWSADLPATKDYKERTEKLAAPSTLKPGLYYIVASHGRSFVKENNQLSIATVWVSELALVMPVRGMDEPQRGFVLEAQSGAPVAGANVTIYERDSDDAFQLAAHTTTDENGVFQFTSSPRNDIVVYAKHKGRAISTNGDLWLYGGGDRERPDTQTVFFTDRAIYRPGQTINYKGVSIRYDQDAGKYSTIANLDVTVVFNDPNGKEIARATHRTNDYGSFSGVFTAPRDRGTGRMLLELLDRPGSTSFSVEEYKRPKFQVDIAAPAEAAKLDAPIVITGKATAYTGAAIGGAKVQWRVTRSVNLPYWCWWFQPPAKKAIAHGTATSEPDGSFKITFTAEPDRAVPAKNEPVFAYSIHADVTDTTGETRSDERTVRAGYTALQATVNADEWQTPEKPVEFSVATKSLDGDAQPASGKLTIRALKQPARVARAPFERNRYWWSTRDSEPPADPSNPDSWEPGATVAERALTTDAKTGATKVSARLKPGIYRASLETKDRFGKTVTARCTVQIVDPRERKYAVKLANHFVAPKWSLEPGEKFSALWSTGYDSGRAYVEVMCDGKTLQSYWTPADRTQALIEQSVSEDMRGGFTVRVTYVRENRAYFNERVVDVPWSNKQLSVKWETFRSKLEPGAKEKWTAIITGPDAKRASAEMVAALYDASLDQFAPHYWAQGFSVFRREWTPTRSRFENASVNFQVIDGGWSLGQRGVEWQYRQFSQGILTNIAGEDDAIELIPFQVSSGPAVGYFGTSTLAGARLQSDLADYAGAPPASRVVGGGMSGTRPVTPPNLDLSKVIARKNLNETAFFFPRLLADADGVVRIEFTMPEALTEWKFLGFAHDKNLRAGFITDKVVTAKDLMVEPNPPRFVREGDAIEFTVKVSNQTDAPQTGNVRLTFADAATLKSVDDALGNRATEQTFDVPAKQSRSYSWRIAIPDGAGFLTYKAVGASAKASDGEEGFLPVLSRRILVTESLPLPIRGKATKHFAFTKLMESGKSDTLRNQSLTVQMTSQPAWYAVMALPYLMEFPHECSEQIFNRLYANALARQIANADPKIRRVFDLWKGTPALDSPLEKNQDLKSVMIEETPWLRQAMRESESRRNLGLLFDANRLDQETAATLRKLTDQQLSDGLWPWFPGGREDEFITLTIVTGFGRLRNLGVPIDVAPAIKALAALDAWMDKRYREILKDPHHDSYVPGHLDTDYLYARTFFLKDQPIAREYTEAAEFFRTQSRKFWLQTDCRMCQAQIALAQQRFGGDRDTPLAIMKSLKERAVTNEELGMFWRDTELSWWWYRAPIETQALMIEAFREVAHDDQAVEDCQVWLLKQKQTQDWKTTKATADAIYALLLQGKNLLASDALVEVSLGGETIKPEKVEAGTGFYEQKFAGGEIKPALGEITVTKVDDGVSWGSVHWQYLEDMAKITPHEGTPLRLVKKLFVKRTTAKGQELEPVNGPLAVGDELVVRIELRTNRDMEYVHLKDQRGSGTEPVNVISRYKYQDGLAYYESTRDTASHFFISYLPKGTYVFEYSTRVQLKGDYQTGIAEIQCMYAPEFNSHSESFALEVR